MTSVSLDDKKKYSINILGDIYDNIPFSKLPDVYKFLEYLKIEGYKNVSNMIKNGITIFCHITEYDDYGYGLDDNYNFIEGEFYKFVLQDSEY